MSERLVVGTRASPLARAQTDLVVRSILHRHPRLEVEVRPLATSGDRDLRAGASPDFTDTIDRALLDGRVDLAVHSAKDLPTEAPPRLLLAACPRRGDPRDCLIARGSPPTPHLPRGARVGSSSLRRRAQLLRWRSDLDVVEIRGNVDTRIRQVREGALDAVIVARAGVHRLGRESEIAHVLPVRAFLPAPAQGALALVTRADDSRSFRVARSVDHRPTRAAVTAERTFAAALGGDCRVPLAALARAHGSRLELAGELLSPDGKLRLRAQRAGPAGRAAEVGRTLARSLLDRGAGALLPSPSR